MLLLSVYEIIEFGISCYSFGIYINFFDKIIVYSVVLI